MELKRSFMALSAVAFLSMGLLLAGCGDTPAAGTGAAVSTSTPDAAKQQFLNERGGTPGPGTPVAGGTGRAPGVFGSIDKIDGNNITVKSPADGSDTVVQLADNATIRSQADGQASDLQQGATVVVSGTTTNGVLTAELVQIGNGGFAGFGGGGGAGFNGTPGAGRSGFNGTPGAGRGFNGTPGTGGGRFRGNNGTPGPNASGTPGPGGGAGRNFTVGTVAKVDGNTVTLNMPNSSTGTFTINSSTRFVKTVDIQAGDLKVGDNIVATGQQNGSVFQATGIQVVPAGGGLGGFGGFGGFGGNRGNVGNGGNGGAQAQDTPTP